MFFLFRVSPFHPAMDMDTNGSPSSHRRGWQWSRDLWTIFEDFQTQTLRKAQILVGNVWQFFWGDINVYIRSTYIYIYTKKRIEYAWFCTISYFCLLKLQWFVSSYKSNHVSPLFWSLINFDAQNSFDSCAKLWVVSGKIFQKLFNVSPPTHP